MCYARLTFVRAHQKLSRWLIQMMFFISKSRLSMNLNYKDTENLQICPDSSLKVWNNNNNKIMKTKPSHLALEPKCVHRHGWSVLGVTSVACWPPSFNAELQELPWCRSSGSSGEFVRCFKLQDVTTWSCCANQILVTLLLHDWAFGWYKYL